MNKQKNNVFKTAFEEFLVFNDNITVLKKMYFFDIQTILTT